MNELYSLLDGYPKITDIITSSSIHRMMVLELF
jgi:hypothetical protein